MANVPMATGRPAFFPGLEKKAFSNDLVPDFMKLWGRIYLEVYSREYPTDEEKNAQRENFHAYSVNCHPFGALYYQDGDIVGALLLNHYRPHPNLGTNTIHIGFVGYDRGLLSRDEARLLKEDWLDVLHVEGRGDSTISSSIYSFNTPSHAYHRKIGLRPAFLKVERRTL